ncbi:MAG: GNAT family N-acetyltransferase [Balneolaceae bacterium]|nr:GNAT family N-acetyltransferase [Balneolaceae bacterium]
MNIRHTVINTNTEFDNLETEWNLLCEQTNSHVFQTFDWNRTWWKYFGDYGKLQIFVLYDEDKIAGIAPLFSDRYPLFGITSYTTLRLIGSNVGKTRDGPLLGTNAYSDYLQFLILDKYIVSFYEHLMVFIKNEVLFDSMILEEIPERSSTLALLKEDFSSSGLKIEIKNASKTTRITSEESGWRGYLKKLSGNERKNVQKSLRKIERTEDNVFRIEMIDRSENFELHLNQLIELHQDQWNREGFPGTFSQKSMKNFFLETCKKLQSKDSIRIYALLPAEASEIASSVAMGIVIIYNNQMYLQHGGMDMTSPLIHIGPGKILNAAIIREAVQANFTFDFLRGNEVYKKRLANKINQNSTIEISTGSARLVLLNKIVNATQRLKKRSANERIRKDIVTKNHSVAAGLYHYTLFMFGRIGNKLNRA